MGGAGPGYERWKTFKRHELEEYTTKRRNFMHRNGISRLSPYLHLGMVSPWRIGREAMRKGASRFCSAPYVHAAFEVCILHGSIYVIPTCASSRPLRQRQIICNGA